MDTNKLIKQLVDKNIWISEKLNQTETKRVSIPGGYRISEVPTQERKVKLIAQSEENLKKLRDLLPLSTTKTNYLDRTLKNLHKEYTKLNEDVNNNLERLKDIEAIFRAFGLNIKNYE